jgi:hypothetical protein
VAVITGARQIAQVMHAWHPEAALREFDIVMVTYGQKVTHGQTNDWTIRSLDEDLPVERIIFPQHSSFALWAPLNGVRGN